MTVGIETHDGVVEIDGALKSRYINIHLIHMHDSFVKSIFSKKNLYL